MLRSLIPSRARDDEQGQLAHALGVILWTLIATSLLILALPFLLPGYLGRALLVIFAVNMLCLPLLVLNRRGFTRLAGAALVVGLWALVTTMIVTAGGASSLTATSYLIVVFVAGLLLGTRAGIATALLCILTTLSLSILEISGHLQARPVADSPLTRWVSLTLLIVIMMSLQNLAARAIKDALLQTRRELGDRKRAESALQANEELLRQFIKHTPAAIAMFDTEMRYLQASDAWLSDYHLGGREIIGRSHYEVSPDIPKRWRDVHTRVLAGASERCDEDPRQLADGTVEWLQWEAIPWRQAGGEIGGLILFAQVITERKRAEEALIESETLFRTIFENSGSAMALIDMNGQPVTFNPALQKILGYTEAELSSMPFTEYTHPDDRQIDWERYGELIAGKRDKYEIEKRFITKDGQILWGNLIVSLVKDVEGLPKYAVGIFQDITERKLAEGELRRVSERLQLATSAASIGIWDWDVVHDELVWDDAMYRLYGIRKENFSGAFNAWEGFLAPEDFEQATVEIQAALRGERPFVHEFRIVWPDGSVHFTKAAFQTFRDEEGRPLRMVGVNYDITARKQAEEALRLSEEQFAKAFQASPEPISIYRHRDGTLLEVNERWQSVFGYSRDEAVGRTALELKLIYPEGRQSLRRHLAAEGSIREVEVELRTRLGQIRQVSLSAEQLVINNETCDIYLHRDITERRRVEQENRTLIDDLGKRVKELRALSAKAQSAREEEGRRIAREIHDELGSSLTALKWDLEKIAKTLGHADNGSANAEVQTRIVAMTSLVESTINTVRRISADLRPSILDDLGMVAAIEWQAQQFRERTGIDCQWRTELETADVTRESATAVFRIFQEILTNVLRHSGATGIQVELRKNDGHLELQVADNGRGITDSEKGNTRSLGLLGMQERAFLVGGEVHIVGAGGQGTTVLVRVPANGLE